MKKLLEWHDKYTLKILVSFLILFTALYPKLPSVPVIRTWVYIRLEDFFILGTVFVWFIQLLRRKVSLPRVFAGAIGLYWTIGFISLMYSIMVIGPTLSGFFPHVAVLSYIRRIEYMILFFVAFSTVRSKQDLRDYFVVLATAVGLTALYGLGQRYYIIFWASFPNFFQNNPFCFPSFQTGNEEFAKGIPLCLPPGGRITSTFGGSYDLGAYLVMVLPIILGGFITLKKWSLRIVTLLVFLAGLMLLIFTAQRAAFIAYLVGSIFTLFFYKKKLFIIPLIIISIFFLSIFSEATAKRFLSTFRVSSVVTNAEGQLIGEALPENLRSRFEKPKGGQDLPTGSAFIGLPQEKQVKTESAIVKKTLTPQEARRLQLEEGTLQISTVSGSFLVRKVLVYDISFTTRFQAEWPNAIRAFNRNFLLGSGYSTITLATDNDYLRALGETGVLGLISFLGVFLVLWIALSKMGPTTKPSLTAGFTYGLAGGILGLLLNAILIDVFEASKVAENLWMLSGIGVGGLMAYKQPKFSYLSEIKRIFTSTPALITYIFVLTLIAFSSSISNFFVGDDFTWLKWAATDNMANLKNHFFESNGFFYRPLDKVITYFLYTVFSFQPQGYHAFVLLLHSLCGVLVFILSKQISKDKFIAFLSAVLFVLLPVHGENILWFSGLSGVLSSLFILLATISYVRFREKKSIISYVLAFFMTIFALMSYEIAVVAPLIFLSINFVIKTAFKKSKKSYLWDIPYMLLIPLYYIVRTQTNTFLGGGDYSYNLVKVIPNAIGNFLGYIGLFIAGENFLPFYLNLRNSMRSQSVLFTGILALVIIALFIAVYVWRKKIGKNFQSNTTRKIVFGIVFALISLLPFLALGNIAQRYLYLGSFGLCFALVVGLVHVFKAVKGDKGKIFAFVVIVIMSIWYQVENYKQINNWRKAGDITRDTLAFFRAEHEGFKTTDNLYVVNTPVKIDNAWVFPVGLNDGLWFIYRDSMPKVTQVATLEEVSQNQDGGSNYIFRFDKSGFISKIN